MLCDGSVDSFSHTVPGQHITEDEPTLLLLSAVAPGDSVAPGQTVTYQWLLPDRAGPGPNDPSSVLWMYHSHVDEAAGPAAGLVGGIIVTTPEYANATDATPNDVQR